MTLYHYTTLDNFFSIWESKALWFSCSKNTNDYFEREKAFVYSQGKFAEKEPVWGYLSFETIISSKVERSLHALSSLEALHVLCRLFDKFC